MKKKRINLMFFVYILGQGGAEKVILHILNNINNEKYNITLVLGQKNNNEYLAYLTNKHVDIVYLDVPLGNNDLAIQHLSEKINEYNPDILLTEARFTNWLAYHAKRISNNKSLKLIFREATIHSKREDCDFKDKLKTFFHYNFGTEKIIAISNSVKMDLVRNLFIRKSKISTIYNPIDLDQVNKKSSETITKKKFLNIQGEKIVNVARMHKIKNQISLLEAFKKMNRKDCTLIIIGTGDMEGELKKYCKDNSISNVCFLGFEKNPYKYVKKCDLFVLTSLFEGFGNVIIEAMALGVPAISTNCSGPSEIIGANEYGVIVPMNDSDSLAIEMKNLLEDKERLKLYRKNGLKRVKDFDVKKIVKQYEKVIDDVYRK